MRAIAGPSILVVAADRAVRTVLHRDLRAAGYRVHHARPGRAALGCLSERQFDLLILDIDSPGHGGADAIRMIRECSPLPLLALSARDDKDAASQALERGADDYVRKPLHHKEFLARVNNALRRSARERGGPARFVSGDLAIDLLHRRVRSREREVHLSAKLYDVLRVLTEHAGSVLTHDAILRAVWGARRVHEVEYVRVAIHSLRCKLEEDPAHPRHILTETGVGYRMDIRELAAPGPTTSSKPVDAQTDAPTC